MLFEKDQKKELIRQNQELKRQLEKARGIINGLYRQIEELKQALGKYEDSQSFGSPQTPKMTVEQQFDHSSDQQTNNLSISGNQNEDKNSIHSPVVKYKGDKLKSQLSNSKGGHLQLRKLNTKIIFNSEEEVQRKSIPKLLKKSSQRKMEFDSLADQHISIKAMSTRQIPLQMPLFGKEFSIRSQKSLFKKTTQSRPIFQNFFVTGVDRNGPIITYSYPADQNSDFSGYLSLIYGQNYLRLPDLSPCNSRNKLSPSIMFRDSVPSTLKKQRESFVIPIMKSKTQSADRDFLIVCEAEESVLQKNDRQLNGCLFPRYYCFLSQWKFFSQLKNLLALLMDRIQTLRKNKQIKSQKQFEVQIGEQLQNSLSFLHQKATDYNKTIDCCIGESGLRFSADVPPFESSFQMVDKYLQNKLYQTTIYIKDEGEQVIETQLYGLLLAYGLAEVKIVLYSNSKVKVCESILEFLELAKPLTYVNPIIASALREQHQTYLDAPMGLILGLWSQIRKSNKQKIQIFMNKKLNLAGMIQKAKLNIAEGIVINLDTGLVFGGSLNRELTSIAVKLNGLSLWSKHSKNLRDYYKFVQRMMGGRCDSQSIKSIWQQLMVYIKKTQLYCYYLENKEQLQ